MATNNSLISKIAEVQLIQKIKSMWRSPILHKRCRCNTSTYLHMEIMDCCCNNAYVLSVVLKVRKTHSSSKHDPKMSAVVKLHHVRNVKNFPKRMIFFCNRNIGTGHIHQIEMQIVMSLVSTHNFP